MFDDVFDEPGRCGGFAAAGCTGDQQAAALRMQPDRLALQIVRDLDGLTRYRRSDLAEVGFEDPADSLHHPGAARRARDDVGVRLDHRQRVGNRHGAAACTQKRMVVLRVADPHDIERRQLQSRKRRSEPARLIDSGREHHDRPLVEDDLQLEPEIVSRTTFSFGSQVATMLRPTESGVTLRRRSSSMKRGGGSSPSGISSPVAQSTSTAPFSTTAASNRSRCENTRRRSGSSRPVTRISLRPDCRNERSAATVSSATRPSAARVPS